MEGLGGKVKRGYVPLHEVQARFNALTGGTVVEPENPPTPRAGTSTALAQRKLAQVLQNDEWRARFCQGRRTTAELIRSFPPISEGGVDETALALAGGGGGKEHAWQDTLHWRCLGALSELRDLETELDLTFKAVKTLPKVGATASNPEPQRGLKSTRTGDEEEVVVQLELQGNPLGTSKAKCGNVQSLVVRSHCSWEVHGPSVASAHAIRPVWSVSNASTRPGTPAEVGLPGLRSASATPDFTAPVRAVGDTAHAVCIDLRERAPEMVIMRRLSTESAVEPAAIREARPETPKVSGHADVDAQCQKLELLLGEKLSAHLDELSKPTPPLAGHAAVAGAAVEAGSGAAAASKQSQGYLRDIRTALRLLGGSMPNAARLLEGAVKGVVLSLDASFAAERRRTEALEARILATANAAVEAEALRRQLGEAQKDAGGWREQLQRAEAKHQKETRTLRHQIKTLKDEIERLSPDMGTLEGMAGLLRDYTDLMQEMEDESGRQKQILEDMSGHAAGIVRYAGKQDDEVRKLRSRQHGRVVELADGEIILRPYGVTDQNYQVNEHEMPPGDSKAPILLRKAPTRLLLGALEGHKVPALPPAELEAEIDRLYSEKCAADAEADAAGLRRQGFFDFILQFYTENLGSISDAEQRLGGILECIRAAEESSTISAKVALFARFLEVCEYDQAIPLPLLNFVLNARRNSEPAFLRQRQELGRAKAPRDSPGGRRNASSVAGASPGEVQVGVAAAFDAAVRALPAGHAGVGGGTQALFECLCKVAEIDGLDPKRGMRDFVVFILIVQDQLPREEASQICDLVERAERSEPTKAEEFRAALHPCSLGDVHQEVWRPRLCASSSGPSNQLSGDLILEYLGSGSSTRLPRATVSETAFLGAVTEAVVCDYNDRLAQLRELWDPWEKRSQEGRRSASYAEFKTRLLAADPDLPAPMLRALYADAVEASRACTQVGGRHCPLLGSLKPAANGLFGGDVVTFMIFRQAAMRQGLFIPGHSGGSDGAAIADGVATARTAGTERPTMVRGLNYKRKSQKKAA